MSLYRIQLKKLVCQIANQGSCSFERYLVFFRPWIKGSSPQPQNLVSRVNTGALVTGIRLYSTADNTPQERKKNSNAKKVLGNVGRLIPYNIIQVISESGENMGNMNKNKVIKIMNERDLKLVLLKEKADPPVYKLMTGKQLFEEQSKLREKQKLSSGSSSVQIMEMSILTRIDKHDLDVKMKHLSRWIEKKHHVRITVINSRNVNSPNKEELLNGILESLQNQATCSSEPKQKREGQAVVCVLRPLSAKELLKQNKDLAEGNPKEPIATQNTNDGQSPNTDLPNP